MNRRVRPAEERFWEKVDKVSDPAGCWLWTASRGTQGYGQFGRGRRGEGLALAHRYAWELLVGPIPEGMQLDHVRARGCVNRHCVNPAHLEVVTPLENFLRGDSPVVLNATKTHCPRGHPYDDANTFIDGAGRRSCRACRAGALRAFRQRAADRRSVETSIA